MVIYVRYNLQKDTVNRKQGWSSLCKTVAFSRREQEVATILRTLFLFLDIFH